jgi:ribosomal protein S18 acetylase RimI-like enzyme
VNELSVRTASVEDAPGIAHVHIVAWQETYVRLVEPGELDDLPLDERIARWQTTLSGGVTRAWVAETDDRIVGFAAAAPRPDPDAPGPIELEAMYLLAEFHGSGAGQLLLDAALGDSPAFLSVAADNPRAIRFYERNGFTFDGVVDSHPLVRTPVATARMVR